MSLILCECGCGTAITEGLTGKRTPRRFAYGHNRRKSVLVYCRGEQVPVYLHDGIGYCSGCREAIYSVVQ